MICKVSMDRVWQQHYAAGTPAEIDPDAWASLVELLQNRIRRFADQPAFANAGSQLSYAEFDEHALALAAYLQTELGLNKGERIALMMPNILPYAVALYAALRAGLVVVNVNPLYTPRELLHQLNDAGAGTLIVWADVAATVAEVIEQTALTTVIITQTADLLTMELPPTAVDVRLGQAVKTVALADALMSGGARRFAAPRLTGDDLAFLQYTGGTTGASKGAMLTHRNIIANMLQVCAMFQSVLQEGEEIIITALPLYHIYALTCNFFAGILFGGLNVLITNPRDLPGLVATLSRWSFTYMTGVNTLYNGLLHTPGFAELDFSTLRLCSAGGMAVQGAVADRWQAVTGYVLTEGYGLSETSPVLTSNPVTISQHNGSIGLPVPSTDIRIVDEAGKVLAIGEAGELCSKGPQIMTGYWRDAAATQQAMTADGYFRTGDIARVDTRGFFYLIDRKKDMILVSGFNVYPNEVEEVIAGMEGVLECACIGVPDARSGEAVVLYVVKQAEAELTADQIIAWCADKLARYKTPQRIEFTDALPKSNVGKILRRALREQGDSTS